MKKSQHRHKQRRMRDAARLMEDLRVSKNEPVLVDVSFSIINLAPAILSMVSDHEEISESP